MVYNRSTDKTDAFVRDHPDSATPVTLPSDLAPCTLTFCSLAYDTAVETVFDSYMQGVAEATAAAPHLPRLFIDMSTVLPSTTRRLAAKAADSGVTYLACPVFGRPPAAAAGLLVACISGGDEAARARVKSLGAVFAQRGVHDLGSDPGAGHALKLTGNFYIAGQIELASEALALGWYPSLC